MTSTRFLPLRIVTALAASAICGIAFAATVTIDATKQGIVIGGFGCTVNGVDSAGVGTVAYKHPVNNTMTILLLNRASSQQSVTLAGAGLPATMDAYQTSPTQNHQKIETIGSSGAVTLPR